MVAGYHLIWTAYGWWLPNDPRGSTSREVRSVQLQDLGELHFGRKKLQPVRRVVKEFYAEARHRLKHELLTLSDAEVIATAGAFAAVVREQQYTCYACAIMPDHIHILIRKHRQEAPEMIDRLQDAGLKRKRGNDAHCGSGSPPQLCPKQFCSCTSTRFRVSRRNHGRSPRTHKESSDEALPSGGGFGVGVG